MKRIILTILAALAIRIAMAAADNGWYSVSTDHEDALYRCGERASFTVTVLGEDGQAATGGAVAVSLDNFGPAVQTNATFDLSRTNPFRISGTLGEPGFLRLCLEKTMGDACGKTGFFSVAYEPERIRQLGRMLASVGSTCCVSTT